MIYTSTVLNEKVNEDDDINLKELLNTYEFNIVFGNYENIEESIAIRNKDNTIIVLIRNRKRDGVKGMPIPHPTCTVKLIKDNYPIFEGMKGLPFEIDPEIKLYKKADNDRNRKVVKTRDYKFLKKVVEENKDYIIAYWNADPDTIEGINLISSIESKIKQKYK